MQTLVTLRQLGIAVDENNANPDGWITINAPHRADTNPSFAININHGGWTDNGTGESGDIYSLVKLVNPSMSYADAKAFVDGKGAKKKLQMKQSTYFGDLNSPFWTDGRKATLASAQERLEKANDSKILKDLISYDGITKKTLQHFECGLVEWEFKPSQPVVALLIPYPTGAQLYARGKDGKMIQMFTGSKPAESFFGASRIKKNKELIICKSPREAMLAQQKLGDRFDCVGICSGESDKLSEQQSSFLKAKARNYKRVFICFDRDTDQAEKIAFGFARKVCDVIGTFKRDICLCNIGKLTSDQCKDLTDLSKSSQRKLMENLFKGDFEYSDYIWNTISNNHRIWHTNHIGKVSISQVSLARELKKDGFGKIYYKKSSEPIMIRKVDNVLSQPSNNQLNDHIKENFIKKYSKIVDVVETEKGLKYVYSTEVEDKYFSYDHKVMSPNYVAKLDVIDVNFMKDTKASSYVYYSGEVVKITDSTVEKIKYSELDGVIWESQIIDRNYSVDSHLGKNCEIADFVQKISNNDVDRISSLETHIGYLLHTYKNPAVPKAVIFIDEKLDPLNTANGGTGKGIIANCIGQIRKQTPIDGKTWDPGHRFAYQNIRPGDQNIYVDDLKKGIEFSSLYSALTNDLVVENKGETRFSIPFELSPKFILTTNHPLDGDSDSSRRRQSIVEFAPYFSPAHTPEMEYGHNFFFDWDSLEWNKFDNYMVHCTQQYIKHGLVTKTVNYERKQLGMKTHPDFVSWAESNLEIGVKYDLRNLFRGNLNQMFDKDLEAPKDTNGDDFDCFLKVSPSALLPSQATTFNKWIVQFGLFKGWKSHKYSSNGREIFIFKA